MTIDCPSCDAKISRILKEWVYGIFQVKFYQCEKCGCTLKVYYKKGKLSHIINNNAPRPELRVMRYLKKNKNASTGDIALTLKLTDVEVMTALTILEKKGKIKQEPKKYI